MSKEKLYPVERGDLIQAGFRMNETKNIRAINTRNFRCPEKGEFYLSGSRGCAYYAPNNLSTAFNIARLVEVEEIKVVNIVKYL